MKDYIEIYDENNNKEIMEAVLDFKLDGYPNNYLVYKTLDDKHYYIAKYKGDTNLDLDTNLDENELKLAQKLLDGVLNYELGN